MTRRNFVFSSLFLGLIVFCIVSCDYSGRRRPWGYVRLGPAKDFLGEMTYEKDHSLLIRRDSRGLYAMSMKCTHDLTDLVPRREAGSIIIASEFSSSTYSLDGKVLTGPAKHPLPFFKLVIESSAYGGPRNTIYAVIGERVPADWRLTILREKPSSERKSSVEPSP